MVLFVWRTRLRYSAAHNPSVIAGNDLRNESTHGGTVCKSKLSAFIFFLLSSLLFSFSTPLFAGSVPAGDLAPYGNPNGQLNIADALILQQFISGIRVPTPTELLIADVAPLGAPDGVLNAADMVVLMQAVTGKITLPPVTRTVPPSPPISSFIVVSAPVNGVVTITGSAGSVEGGTYVTLLNYATGQTVTVKAQSNGSFSTNISGASGQVFSVVSTDIFGNASSSTSVGASNLPTLTITSPLEGTQLGSDSIFATGTYQGPPNTGITVNGQVACTDGAAFYANNLPLTVGTNAITANATSPSGMTASAQVNVTVSAQSLVAVSVSPACGGIAPHTATFTVSNNSGNTIQRIEADFDGNGTVDSVITDSKAPIQFTYTSPGTYLAKFTTTDNQGNIYNSTIAVIVTTLATADSAIQGVWQAMKASLASGNIEQALTYFSADSRGRYRQVLTNIAPALPAMFGNFPDIHPSKIGDGDAEYFVTLPNSGKNYGYFIYFMRGPDGVMRLQGM